MIQKIKAISLSFADQLKLGVYKNSLYDLFGPWDNILMISINNSDFHAIYTPSERISVHHFDDITPKATFMLSNLVADKFMDTIQASYILNFIDRWHSNKATKDLLLVHCHAGICRSGAVAAFAQFYCQTDFNMFLKDNPNIQPNHWVEEKLYEALRVQQPVDKTVEGIFRH